MISVLWWYCFPTCLNHIIFYSTIIIRFCLVVLLLLFFLFVVYCVLFVYCDIVYNVFMLSILLWGRCLPWVVVVVPFAFLPFWTIVWLLYLYYGTNKVVKIKLFQQVVTSSIKPDFKILFAQFCCNLMKLTGLMYLMVQTSLHSQKRHKLVASCQKANWLILSSCSKPVDNKFWQSTRNKSVNNLQQFRFFCQQVVASRANAPWRTSACWYQDVYDLLGGVFIFLTGLEWFTIATWLIAALPFLPAMLRLCVHFI